MATKQYVGARYVPLYIGVHDSTIEYEPLSIVSNKNKTATYTSKQKVPKGIALTNEEYWAESGYYQAGIENINGEIENISSSSDAKISISKDEENADIKLSLPKAFNAGNTFNTAYVLNDMKNSGVYIIKPSACAEVPSDIEDSEDPAILTVFNYRYKSGEKEYYIQQIKTTDSAYVRLFDGNNWNEWQSQNVEHANFDKYGTIKFDDESAFYISEYNGSLGVNRIIPANLTNGQSSLGLSKSTKYGEGGLFVRYGNGLNNTASYGGLALNIASSTQLGGIKIGNGLAASSDGTTSINLINAIKEGTWTAELTQSAAWNIDNCIYYRYPDNRIFVYCTFDDMKINANSMSGSGVNSSTLPTARALNHAYSVKGAITQVDTSSGGDISAYEATITFDANGALSAFKFVNPTNTSFASATGALTFEYYGSPRL